MTATNEAVLMTDPPPDSSKCGIPCLQHRNTDSRLTRCTRCQASSDVSSTETSSSGEMPALLKRTWIAPYSSRTRAYIARTASSSVTSQASARSPTPSSRRSTPATVAPSAPNRRALSAPIPLAAPVMTQTLPARRPPLRCSAVGTGSGRIEDRLDLGVVVERVRAQLAAVARLLEAAERRRHPHRGVGVDRQHAGLECARHAQRLRTVAGPDRAGKPVDGVVGERDRLFLVAEGDHDRHRTEDLLAHRAGVTVDRAEHRRGEPVAG